LRSYILVLSTDILSYFFNVAREAFIDELKGKLDSNHQEIGSIKQELETSNNRISELEETRRMYEEKIQDLSGKGSYVLTKRTSILFSPK
jgi:FtsZ-binding cell division protein ZapB